MADKSPDIVTVEDALIALNAHNGEGEWFFSLDETRKLHAWLGKVLAPRA